MQTLKQEIDRMTERDTIFAGDCATCEDRGYILLEQDGQRRARACGCMQRKGLARRVRNAGVPARYAQANFENFDLTRADAPVRWAAETCRQMAEEFLVHPYGQGLLLTGTCGVGKTHLAAAALHLCMERYGVAGKFWDMNDLLTQVKRSFQRKQGYDAGGPETESTLVDEFARVEVLVIDELGGERLTDWSFGEVSLLLNARYNAQGDKPRLTIFTTNFANAGAGQGKGGVETLGDRIGSRMWSRLQEMTKVVEMQGRDYRLGRGR